MYLGMLLLMRMFFPFSQLHPNAGARLRQEISLIPPDLQPLSSDQGGELMHDHMFNPNSSCEEVCAGNGVDLAASERTRLPSVQERTSFPSAPEWTSLPSAPERTSLLSVPERTSLPSAPERTSADRTSSDRTSSGVDQISSPVTGQIGPVLIGPVWVPIGLVRPLRQDLLCSRKLHSQL
jgi:hypothetical protein